MNLQLLNRGYVKYIYLYGHRTDFVRIAITPILFHIGNFEDLKILWI